VSHQNTISFVFSIYIHALGLDYFYVLKIFLKKVNFFIFLYFKLIYFGIFVSFWCADIKNNILKNIYIILMYFWVKYILKRNWYNTSKNSLKKIIIKKQYTEHIETRKKEMKEFEDYIIIYCCSSQEGPHKHITELHYPQFTHPILAYIW
jgi:hypothetical protein